jgi:thiol:disulfide interchange protein DsbD
VASFGGVFGSFLGNPWVVGAIALFCAAMGASMLGAFTIQLPPTLATRLSSLGGNTVGGAFIMGLVSGSIAAPCTGPVLGVILAVIAAKGALLGGFALMLAFGLGLGAPFVALAIFAESLGRLPRGGRWMELVKVAMGSAMFVVAVYFARLGWPALDDALASFEAALAWGVGLGMVGLVAMVLLLRPAAPRAEAIARWSSVVLLTVAASLLLFSEPDQTILPGGEPIAWSSQLDEALARARAEGRPVMIDFSADWCLGCKDLDDQTFVDERVRAEARRFVSVKLAEEEHEETIEAVWDRYGVRGLPTVLFIDSEGRVLKTPRVTGFVHAQRFAELMARVR